MKSDSRRSFIRITALTGLAAITNRGSNILSLNTEENLILPTERNKIPINRVQGYKPVS